MIDKLQSRLAAHELYLRVQNAPHVRCFMEHHVACVWDFMSLLKSLQRDVAGNRLPWTPPLDRRSARLINEIVLDEESDEVDGEPMSHFELYLEAMDEIGADASPMRRLVAALTEGMEFSAALGQSDLPVPCQHYLAASMALLEEPLWARAAVFHRGREEIIPRMFTRVVAALEARDIPCAVLRLYLSRHIETDSIRHGPLAARLAEITAHGDEAKQRQAEEAAIRALRARLALWDAVAAEL